MPSGWGDLETVFHYVALPGLDMWEPPPGSLCEAWKHTKYRENDDSSVLGDLNNCDVSPGFGMVISQQLHHCVVCS